MAKQVNIPEVNDIDIAFGGCEKVLPPKEEIPDRFWDGHTKWNRMVSTWFFCGLKNLELKPKEGVDQEKAMRVIKTILGSFAPKHEHKEAACAYLLDKWFDDASYAPRKNIGE